MKNRNATVLEKIVQRAILALFLTAAAAAGQPERKAAPDADAPTLEAHIAVPVRFTAEGMTGVVNRHAPGVVAASGMEGSRMAGVEYDVAVTVKTPFTAVADGGGVDVAAVLHGEGEMRVWATRLRLLREQPSGDIAIRARAVIDIDPFWEPTADIDVAYEWLKKPRIIWNSFSISNFIDPMIAREIDKARILVPEKMRALGQNLRMAMEGFWVNMQNPVPLPAIPDAPLWLHLEPESIRVLAPGSRDGDLLLNIAIRAKTRVSAREEPPLEKTSLPELGRSALREEGFRLAVPILLPYALLEREIARLCGEASAAFEDWEVYPSHPRLVVGARPAAESADSPIDPEASFHFEASPEYDAETGMLTLRDVADAAPRFLRDAAVLDLREILDAAVARINAFLENDFVAVLAENAENQGTYLDLLLDSIRAEGAVRKIERVDLVLADDGLVVLPVLSGDLSLELTPFLY